MFLSCLSTITPALVLQYLRFQENSKTAATEICDHEMFWMLITEIIIHISDIIIAAILI